jgi:monovalent cation:H+ antiporter, CPA1 family
VEQFLDAETLVIELLLSVSLVALAVRRLHVPYTVALVVAGLVVTLRQPMQLEMLPEVILALFVPPLVFEAAFHLNLSELRRNLASLLLLAVPGVVLTMLIVGGVVGLPTPVGRPLALVSSALIAATDPVAVVAVFRVLGVPGLSFLDTTKFHAGHVAALAWPWRVAINLSGNRVAELG